MLLPLDSMDTPVTGAKYVQAVSGRPSSRGRPIAWAPVVDMKLLREIFEEASALGLMKRPLYVYGHVSLVSEFKTYRFEQVPSAITGLSIPERGPRRRRTGAVRSQPARFGNVDHRDSRPEMVRVNTAAGHGYGFVGPAEAFSEASDASAEMARFAGIVGWIEWVQTTRGAGAALVRQLVGALERHGATMIGLQVVPKGADPDAPAVHKLVSFYAQHGFVVDTGLAPWSDYPLMVKRT